MSIIPKTSLTWKEARERHAQIDAEVTRVLSEQPRIRTSELAALIGVSYMDTQRSFRRLGITRPKDLKRKKGN